MSNESKIGLMAVIVIAIAIWGYKFLQGQNLLSTSTVLYVEYDDVTELAKSAPVLKNGYQVGVVADIYLKPDDANKIIVALSIDEDISVPKSARAILLSLGVMSGKGIELDFARPCSGTDCAESGDYLQGVSKGLLASMLEPTDLPPYIDEINKGVKGIMDTLQGALGTGESDSALGKMALDLQATMANLKLMTAQMNNLMAANAKSINGLLENMEQITGNLAASNAQITATVGNASNFSGQLAEGKVIEKANSTLEETQVTMEELQKTLATLNNTVGQVSPLLADINAGKGSIGLLMKDEELYRNLNKATREMELLLQDVRLHPKRYTRILSKKEKPYEIPADDPARKN